MMFIKDNTAVLLLHAEITQEVADEAIANIYGIEHLEEIDNILVSINSGGGSVLAGMSIFSALRNSTKYVETRIEGIAASIAGVIYLSGNKKTMLDYSLFMMHNPSGGNKAVLGKIKDMLKIVLSKDFDMFKLDKMMNDETWLNAKEMKKMGIIDTVINSKKEVKLEITNGVEDLYMICNNILKNNKNDMQEEIKGDKVEDVIEVVENSVEEVIETVEEDVIETVEEEIENVTETVEEVIVENSEIDTLKEIVKTLTNENEDMKKQLDVINAVKIEEVKLEILSNSVIVENDYSKWMNLDIETIKDLTTNLKVTVASPKLEIGNDKKEMNLSNMTKEEKLEFSNSNPKLYVELIRKQK